jgi:hypothetical protein
MFTHYIPANSRILGLKIEDIFNRIRAFGQVKFGAIHHPRVIRADIHRVRLEAGPSVCICRNMVMCE